MQDFFQRPEIMAASVMFALAVITGITKLVGAWVNAKVAQITAPMTDQTARAKIREAAAAVVEELETWVNEVKAEVQKNGGGFQLDEDALRRVREAAYIKIARTVQKEGIDLWNYYTETRLRGLLTEIVEARKHGPKIDKSNFIAIHAAESPRDPAKV